MAEFTYNNAMHSSTQKTCQFKVQIMVCTCQFKVQGVHNIVNFTVEDQTMWLANIRAQLVSNLEKTQRLYKDNAYVHHKDQPNFKVENQVWF
jgi:hypothetical protein